MRRTGNRELVGNSGHRDRDRDFELKNRLNFKFRIPHVPQLVSSTPCWDDYVGIEVELLVASRALENRCCQLSTPFGLFNMAEWQNGYCVAFRLLLGLQSLRNFEAETMTCNKKNGQKSTKSKGGMDLRFFFSKLAVGLGGYSLQEALLERRRRENECWEAVETESDTAITTITEHIVGQSEYLEARSHHWHLQPSSGNFLSLWKVTPLKKKQLWLHTMKDTFAKESQSVKTMGAADSQATRGQGERDEGGGQTELCKLRQNQSGQIIGKTRKTHVSRSIVQTREAREPNASR
ncbi:hypothetical protein DFH06DRAFT_1124080 [Mycena polygramma]|nr:hypothetical protein DFH06DRAFT_1124080 [Mycena polygramma]